VLNDSCQRFPYHYHLFILSLHRPIRCPSIHRYDIEAHLSFHRVPLFIPFILRASSLFVLSILFSIIALYFLSSLIHPLYLACAHPLFILCVYLCVPCLFIFSMQETKRSGSQEQRTVWTRGERDERRRARPGRSS
jgi:hypothetical protein